MNVCSGTLIKASKLVAHILSISSQVVRGTVGNSVATFVMQRLGHIVYPIPTVVYSNHPGHGGFTGTTSSADEIAALWDGITAHGWHTQIDAVLTGYLPNKDAVEASASIVRDLKAGAPDLVYLCDPAIGDEPNGLYVPEDAAGAIRELLLPMADVATPNRFELSWLTETDLASDPTAAVAALGELPSGTGIATSISSPLENTMCNVLTDGSDRFVCPTPCLSSVPKGTGDAFSAIYLSQRLNDQEPCLALGMATASVRIILESSIGSDELNIVASQDAWVHSSPDPTERLNP